MTDHRDRESSHLVALLHMKLFSDMGLNITARDLLSAHSLSCHGTPASSTIVRFENQQDRDTVFANRHMLKNIGIQRGYKIFVKEDLGANLRNIFRTTRKLLADEHIESV